MDLHGAIEEYLLAKQNVLTQKTFHWYSYFLSRFEEWCRERSAPINVLSQVTPGVVQQFASDTTPNTHTRHARAPLASGSPAWYSEVSDMGVTTPLVERTVVPGLVQSAVELF